MNARNGIANTQAHGVKRGHIQKGDFIMKIFNLTQHDATPEQIAEGVNAAGTSQEVKRLLTFDQPPTWGELSGRAADLAACVPQGYQAAMIGGAPYLMGVLEKELKQRGIKPLYAFSARVSIESAASDGTVTKTNVFKHVGWVEGGL